MRVRTWANEGVMLARGQRFKEALGCFEEAT
jgi:hypothetical protein